MTTINCPSVLASVKLQHRDIAPTVTSDAIIDNEPFFLDVALYDNTTPFISAYYNTTNEKLNGLGQCADFISAVLVSEVTEISTDMMIKFDDINNEKALTYIEYLTHYYDDVTVYRSYLSQPTSHEYFVDCHGIIDVESINQETGDPTIVSGVFTPPDGTNGIVSFVNLDALHNVMKNTSQQLNTLTWADLTYNHSSNINGTAEGIMRMFDNNVKLIQEHATPTEPAPDQGQ